MKIDFQFNTKHGLFSDAITLPDDHTYTDAEIDAMKQERLANWITILETPSTPTEEVIE